MKELFVITGLQQASRQVLSFTKNESISYAIIQYMNAEKDDNIGVRLVRVCASDMHCSTSRKIAQLLFAGDFKSVICL